jgi:hydrogenase/urease accessory protein HupE
MAADSRRKRRIARHVRLAASHERALAHDLRKIVGRAAAAHVAAGQDHLAVAVVAGFEPAIAAALRAWLQVAAIRMRSMNIGAVEDIATRGRADR